MAHELDGQVAIVTGAGRGIGKAIALGLARAGAAVTLTARSTGELDSAVREIERAGGRAFAIPGDVTRRSDVERVIGLAQRHFGPCTLLVSNAGIPGTYGPLWVSDPDEWWHTQEVHLRGALLYLHATLPSMTQRRAGRVIVMSSAGGTRVNPLLSAYSVAKCAQIRLVEHVAAEAKASGVSVFAIQPGTIATSMADSTLASPEAQRWVPEMLAILKHIKATEDATAGLEKCAQMCVQLASGRYDALTGRYLTNEDDFEALLAQVRA